MALGRRSEIQEGLHPYQSVVVDFLSDGIGDGMRLEIRLLPLVDTVAVEGS
jgi:hypothetical protein